MQILIDKSVDELKQKSTQMFNSYEADVSWLSKILEILFFISQDDWR